MAKQGTKLCKYCKTEIPAGAKICPNCKKKQGGALKWVVIVIVVLVIISAAAGGGDKDENQQASSTNNTSNNSENSQNASQDASKETTPQETKDKYSVGDTWENKYVLVSYDECGEYVSDNQFIQPADGNRYIYAKFTFENVGKSDTTVAYWDFDCYADGYACESTYGADNSAFTQTLSSGRKISGSVYFEVPKDAEEIEFEFSPNFWTSEKIVFVYSE